MPHRSWRDCARPMIAEVIGVFSPGDDERMIKKAVLATYPDDWRPRKYLPYKIWLDETKRQLLARRSGRRYPMPPGPESDPRQASLF